LTRVRYEIKYGYFNSDFSKIDTILKVNNRPVSHNRKESVVNSVYFDDCRLTSFRENVEGIGTRLKLRLRWYDSKFPNTKFFFEIKRRFNYVMTKDRYAIISHRPFSEMTYHEIVQGLLQVLPETPGELLRTRQIPVVLIRYRRRHYSARDPQIPIRITLDHAITAYDQMAKKGLCLRFGAPLYDRIVLETKSAVGAEGKIPELLYPLKPRQTKFSKYALGCRQIGFVTGIYSAA